MDPANTPTPPTDNQPPAGAPPQTPSAGGQSPAGTPPQGAQPPQTPPTGAPPQGGQLDTSWINDLPDDLKAQESLKVFKDVPGLAKGFIDLKTKLGSYPKIPNDKSTPEEQDKFYRSLGKPETPDGYEIKRSDKLPKEVVEYEKESMPKFAALAHKANLTASQFKTIMEGYDEISLESVQRASQNSDLKTQQENEAKTNMLKQKWGRDYEMNMAKAERAFNFLNPDGTATNAEIFAKLSEYISEDTYGSGSPAADYITVENQLNDAYTKLSTQREGTKEYRNTVELIHSLAKRKASMTSPIR